MYTKDGFHKALEQKLGDDAYLLLANGGHKKLTDLLTAASLTADGNNTKLSITVGGTTKTSSVTVPYASAAAKWSTARTLTIGSTGKSVNGSANVSWSLDEIGVYSKTASDDRFVNVTGDWMNDSAQLYWKGINGSTSVYTRMGYYSYGSTNMPTYAKDSHNNTKAFYIMSNGYDAGNDWGGLSIDDEGVSIFGAGDAANNFTGVFRVFNEDNFDDGPQFIVTKGSGATTKYVHNAQRFVSSVGTGTQPYACSSTTVNTNLNADLLDGIHANGLLTAASLGASGNSTTISVTVGGTTKTGSVTVPYASNADKVDGIHANGLLTAASLGASGNSTTISVTVGGTTKTGSVTVPYATNSDTVDGYHEGSFFRYRGSIDVNYVDLTTYTSNATNYQNPSNGVWNVSRSGYSAGLITFTGSGSASGLDIYFHYAKGADFKFRRRIDSNRLSGNWEIFITSENIGSQSVNYASSAGSVAWGNVTGKPSTFAPSSHNHDSSYVKKSGDTMTGDLTTTGVKGSGTSNRIIFRHLDGQNCNGDYNLYLQYHQSNAVTYFNGGTYYIKGGYYNGTAAAANSVAWGNVTGKPSQYLWFSKAIDARGLNENTWYPVTFNASGSIHYGTIHVMVNRKLEGKNASWCTHPSGFSVGLWFEMCASGWGTYPWYYYVHHFNYSFCDQPPLAGITQDTMSSTGIIYVRGGEYYNFFCSDNDVTFTLRTSKYYTINSSPYIYSVEPLSSRPTDITVDRVSKYYVDSVVSSAASSGYVTINYNNDSNSTYQMLWGSGNSVYGTGGIYCNPYTDYLYAGSFYCGNWFRSSGATGWYNESYGGGIYMEDTTYVRTYNSKQFYVSSTSQHAIYTAGGFASANTDGYILSTYYNGTWYGDTIRTHGNGNLSISAPGDSLFLAYYRGNTYFGGGTYYINRSGYFNGSCSYASSAGSVAWTNVTGRPNPYYSENQPGYHVSHSGWAYTRYTSGSLWDIGTNQSGGGFGSNGGFGIRQDGSDNNGIYIRRNTSSYGKLAIGTPSGECSIGFFVGGNAKWTVGCSDGTNYGWYQGSGGGWKMTLDTSGNLTATNFYTTSDRNKKQNISEFSEHIRKFQLKDTEKWYYGVIAQEVPEMFRNGEEGNMTVNYNSVLSYYIGLLENKVKQQDKEIKELKQKIGEA